MCSTGTVIGKLTGSMHLSFQSNAPPMLLSPLCALCDSVFPKGRDPIKEADIRPIAKTLDWNKQRHMWNRLRQGVIDSSIASQ